MSVYDDMARDAGYTGDGAVQVARMLEEQRREEVERDEFLAEHDHDCCPPDNCCGGPCDAHPCWELTT